MYSKGISWIDDCRIPFVDDIDLEQTTHQKTNGDKYGGGKGFHKEPIVMQMYKPQGRFPANILVSDDMLNDGNISKGGRMINLSNPYDFYEGTQKTYTIQCAQQIDDKGTNSRYYDIDKWFEKLLND
jgi:hypothetical protein